MERRTFLYNLAASGGLVNTPHLFAPFLDFAQRGLVLLLYRRERSQATALADRLNSWRFPNQQLVSDVFPEVTDYANLLKIEDISRFFPLSLPLRVAYVSFSSSQGAGALERGATYAKDKEIQLITTYPTGESDEIPILLRTDPVILIDKSLKGKNAELVVLVKELSQVHDFLRYSRKYKELLEKQGQSFQITGPNPQKISKEAVDFSIATILGEEEKQKKGRSYFLEFIDTGSFIRAGVIHYANWKRHFASESQHTHPALTRAGEFYLQKMQQDGFFKLEDGIYKWVAGKAPSIESDDFVKTFARYTGRI